MDHVRETMDKAHGKMMCFALFAGRSFYKSYVFSTILWTCRLLELHMHSVLSIPFAHNHNQAEKKAVSYLPRHVISGIFLFRLQSSVQTLMDFTMDLIRCC